MGVSVNIGGVNLGSYAKVMDVRRDILPPRRLITESLSERSGSYLMGVDEDSRSIEIDVMFIEDSPDDIAEAKRELAEILDTDDVVPMTFSDESGLTYYGIVYDSSELRQELHTARATIKFFLPDPHAYGSEVIYQMSGDSATFNVDGNRETYPIIEVEFHEDTPFFAITHTHEDAEDEQYHEPYILIGEPEDVEQETVKERQTRALTNFRNHSGINWTGGDSDDVDGVAHGTMTRVNGLGLTVTDGNVGSPGTFSTWHGGCWKRVLPAGAQDFRLEVEFMMYAVNGKTGRVEAYVKDDQNITVGKIQYTDARLRGTRPRFYGRAGNLDGYILVHRQNIPQSSFAPMEGKMTLERRGRRWRSSVQTRPQGTTRWTTNTVGKFMDVYEKEMAEVRGIVLSIQTFDGETINEPIAIQRVGLYELFEVEPDEVPEIFVEEDKLIIDCERGEVTLNGELFMRDFDAAGSEFFSLKPGRLNTLSAIPTENATVTIRHRPRWI